MYEAQSPTINLTEMLHHAELSLVVTKKEGITTIAFMIGTLEIPIDHSTKEALRAELVKKLLKNDGIPVTLINEQKSAELNFSFHYSKIKKTFSIFVHDREKQRIVETRARRTNDPSSLMGYGKEYQPTKSQPVEEVYEQYKDLGIMKLAFSLLAECLLAQGIHRVSGEIDNGNYASFASRVNAPALFEDGYYETECIDIGYGLWKVSTNLTHITKIPSSYPTKKL